VATDPLQIARALAQRFADTAVARDQAGGHAVDERTLLRESGLLTLAIPHAFGGQGADWPTVYQVIRILAEADSALAHVFAFHHLQLASIRLFGTEAQQRELLGATVASGIFWGNAANPLDKRVQAVATPTGFQLDGIKSFSSGSVGADWLLLSAWHAPSGGSVVGVLPAQQDGIVVQPDWDAFGQRQTDSGNVHLTGVQLPSSLVLQAPGAVATPKTTLRTQVSQLIMTNLYLGIAQGAFAAARAYTREQSRAWPASGVDNAVDDPLLQHRYGQLWLLLRPAQVLADLAARELDHVFRKGEDITADDRGRVAIAVAEAKCLAHQASIEISSQMFELTGARATSRQFGFDRFWRNARVHTLHDPVDYKLRDLGRHALTGAWPEPGPYA
jgi:alkylation response protein AidB-like acyl-CoA dehydrogenase